MVTKKCIRCGFDYVEKPYRAGKSKYCSYNCYWGRSEDIGEKTCTKCNKTLSINNFVKINRGFGSNCRNCKNKEWKNWARRNDSHNRFRWYEYQSKRVGRQFDIDFETFKKLTIDNLCYYCGSETDRLGLDRVDSSLGYFNGNVVPCCFRCNHAKSDMSQEDFLILCNKIAKNHAIT